MKKVISINLDVSVVNLLEDLAKIENRNKSNLLNKMIKNYYENLTLKERIKLTRMEILNFDRGDE